MKLKYPDTDVYVEVGDIVKFFSDNDSTMFVEDIIDTQEKKKLWGLKKNTKNCIMMKGKKYGRITDPLDKNSEVVFIERKRTKT